MRTDRDMPEAWSRNAGRSSAEITAAIERARKVRATAAPAPTSMDELAQRRLARRAAEDARRKLRPTDPPGPRTA
ncbi:hypothetical protein Q5424_22110 [Conexibacter sp. JD483]|uniref:hypothetical protein n=1 Tax=unclassified Conexibacter TaxID=2627773 RepID=UPI00271B8585|nr:MULTISPECIES: hypothetical protein [unclassified Conexibacter]MDO8186592.1 hypothetical protein [Conexibacter sp. CPCC 205706]MDO8196697.1 hypothetical protein [Conexibacter sp. CPCC 205762]MDR9371808.1 hypothetical protein [Conexibacter sp. JD483]